MAAPPGAFSTFLRVLNEDAVEEATEEVPAEKRTTAKKSGKAAVKRTAAKSKK